jgi:hypothetical protein
MEPLETMLEQIAARADEAAQRLDALSARLDGKTAPDPADPVRLAAIELAVSGCDRAQAAARLRDRFPGTDLTAVLADVYGS